MENTVAGFTGKKVLILSDHDKLSQVIEWHLNSHLGVKVVRLAQDSLGQRKNQTEVGDCDLMVVAMSSHTSEPILALARASLTERIGKIPLLIISDRPFDADPDKQIAHLDFPFEADRLRDKVKEMLQVV